MDHRGQPIALAAACISLAALDQPDAEALCGPSAADRASAAEAAAASVAADVQLRASLLEGLCLFASGAVMEGRAGAGAGSAVGGELAEVPRVLAARVASHAEAVAEAALALQRDLQLGQQGSAAAGDESGPEQQQQRGGGGGAMTAVPAAGPLADGLAADGSLMEIMPPQLMHVPSCRAMQLRLLALQVRRDGRVCRSCRGLWPAHAGCTADWAGCCLASPLLRLHPQYAFPSAAGLEPGSLAAAPHGQRPAVPAEPHPCAAHHRVGHLAAAAGRSAAHSTACRAQRLL